MRVVFMGTPAFALPVLSGLITAKHEVVGVVTAPDKPAGRSLKLVSSPVKIKALEACLPIVQPENLKDPGFLRQLSEWRPDIGVVVAFRLLPVEVFSIPKSGCINLHASLLPELRGAAPINWAIIRGLSETGVTTFLIDRGMDTGGILLQEAEKIYPEDNADRLSSRLSELGAAVVLQTLECIQRGRISPRIQAGEGSRAPKIRKEDCLIKWDESSEKVINHIRGLAYEPGAYSLLNDKVLKIYKARKLTNSKDGLTGSVAGKFGMQLGVNTGDGVIGIEELQLEGKRRMSADEFMRGKVIPVGTKLGIKD